MIALPALLGLIPVEDPLAPARAHLEAGRPQAAALALVPLAERADARPETLALLAEAWVELGRPERFESLLDRLAATSDLGPEAVVPLAERLAATRWIGKAGALLDAALARKGDDPSLLLAAARQRFGIGQPGEALGFLERRAGPGSPGGEYLRGACLRALGRESEAEAALRRAVALDPCSAPALAELGRILEGRGDLDGALRSFDSALASDADALPAALGRARVLARLGRKEEADLAFLRFRVIGAFEELWKVRRASAEDHPGDAGAWTVLGQFLLDHRQYRKCLTPLRRALDLDAGRADTLEALARAHLALGDAAEAVRLLGPLHARLPDRGDLALRLAEAEEEEAAPPERVAALLDRAARLGCEEPGLDLARGRLALRAGRDAEALARFEAAVRSDPARTEAWLASALLLLRLGRAEEAERNLRAAIASDASNPAPRLALVRLLSESGRTAEAEAETIGAERVALEALLKESGVRGASR